ncbi:MAG: hypothetical protein HC889_19335 [Synechococcaceae cyanobacterium SM1_2_3]|nr:hypothetical protein [Synechococcaceae cyanobacterium SM1_2_3]
MSYANLKFQPIVRPKRKSWLYEIARRLAEVGLIDEQTLQPLAWEKRQFISDNDATAKDRKRRQRA